MQDIASGFGPKDILSLQHQAGIETFSHFLKGWARALIEVFLNILYTYPLNSLLILGVIAWVFSIFLNKVFRYQNKVVSYQKHQHVYDPTIDIRNIKRETRETQMDLIDLQKKINKLKQNPTQSPSQQEIPKMQASIQKKEITISNPKLQALNKKVKTLLREMETRQQFNSQLQRQLRKSTTEVSNTLSKINNNSA